MYNEFFSEMFELHEVDSMNCYSVVPMKANIWVTVCSLRAFQAKMDYHIDLERIGSKLILPGIQRACFNFHHIELAVGEFNK